MYILMTVDYISVYGLRILLLFSFTRLWDFLLNLDYCGVFVAELSHFLTSGVHVHLYTELSFFLH